MRAVCTWVQQHIITGSRLYFRDVSSAVHLRSTDPNPRVYPLGRETAISWAGHMVNGSAAYRRTQTEHYMRYLAFLTVPAVLSSIRYLAFDPLYCPAFSGYVCEIPRQWQYVYYSTCI
jgi:hypothetical protein